MELLLHRPCIDTGIEYTFIWCSTMFFIVALYVHIAQEAIHAAQGAIHA
jgi:hypothetical protein